MKQKPMKTLATVVLFAVSALSMQPGDTCAEMRGAESTDVVYVTASGKRYHRADCRYAKNAQPVSRQEAEGRGLTPCKVCKP